jgi:hypothetical protein
MNSIQSAINGFADCGTSIDSMREGPRIVAFDLVNKAGENGLCP